VRLIAEPASTAGSAAAAGVIEIDFTGGTRLRIAGKADPATMSAVIAALTRGHSRSGERIPPGRQMMISPLSVTLRDAVCPFAARRLGIDGVRGLRDGSFPRKSRNVTGSRLERALPRT
jgi:hypothetical protein